MTYLGEFAALGTAVCWSFGSTAFTIASRRIGALAVNRLRLLLGCALLLVTHVLLLGRAIPHPLDLWHLGFFGASGLIGFALGDSLLFQSFALVGPRLGMLLMSGAPIMTTLIGLVVLHESPSWLRALAMTISVMGIALVILDKRESEIRAKGYRRGIISGIGAALCQAIGLVLSRAGLTPGYSALSGNLIRITIATIGVWVVAGSTGKAGETWRRLSDRPALNALLAGAVCGPFLGVWLSLVAIQHTQVGVASTIMALPPVLLIPMSRIFFKEQVTLRSVIGTLVATLGVALIFLWE